jgi:DNA mismatch repair ATPase MutL
VRFLKKGTVQRLVQTTVSETLNNTVRQQLSSHNSNTEQIQKENYTTVFPARTDFDSNFLNFKSTIKTSSHDDWKSDEKLIKEKKVEIPAFWSTKKDSWGESLQEYHNPQPTPRPALIQVEKNQEIIQKTERFKIIGQLLNSYILIENQNGLLMIDQHAAHERIIFEELNSKKSSEKKILDGTKLMFAPILKLEESQIQAIIKIKDFLSQRGIEIEEAGRGRVAIKSCPPKMNQISRNKNQTINNHDFLKELILEAVEFVIKNESLNEEEFDEKLNQHLNAQIACKLAIKSGDTLPFQKMESLVSQLFEAKNRLICIHGRPTIWQMSKSEIEKVFRRK